MFVTTLNMPVFSYGVCFIIIIIIIICCSSYLFSLFFYFSFKVTFAGHDSVLHASGRAQGKSIRGLDRFTDPPGLRGLLFCSLPLGFI